LEGWEKVILTDEEFAETIHGEMGCIACHGGDGESDDKEQAHIDMRREPIAAEACNECHDDLHQEADSLHSTLRGYTTVLEQRASAETMPIIMEEAFGNHCESCHTSCGQCHVSRPTNLGGGLTAGHKFKKIPPMNLTCTGCHGSRIEMEYKGKNEGVPADVHWTKGGMPCFECHTADELHGNVEAQPNHRYDGAPTPGCTEANCHANILEDEEPEFKEHRSQHLENMSCQTCHAANYKNCYSCHVQKSEEGTPYFKIEPSEMGFKIGYNPIQSEDRPWKWVTLRHVPIDPDTFAFYGVDLLPNFDALPTWTYATPHNIQRITPQAERCKNCHGNPDVFLTADDLLPYEIEANKDVVVDEADVPEF
jgi:thiosulfate/3-mercaptopyruvate sulfurtransferase